MRSRHNHSTAIPGTNIVQREQNIEIATIEIIVMISKTRAIPPVVSARMNRYITTFPTHRQMVSPDVQPIIIDIALHVLKPVGIIDQRLKSWSPLDNIRKLDIGALYGFGIATANMADPFVSGLL